MVEAVFRLPGALLSLRIWQNSLTYSLGSESFDRSYSRGDIAGSDARVRS